MASTRTVHLKVAAFDEIAERVAEQVFKRLDSGALDIAMSLLLRARGWTCTAPKPAEQPQQPTQPPAARRKRGGR
jgi:hypothetical protein